MLYRTDDPLADFDRHDLEQARLEARLPVCEERKCGKRIHDDDYYEVDGEILCEKCMIRRYRRSVEDYIEI
jgi:hypothetical protein